jgi:hypothetical protein
MSNELSCIVVVWMRSALFHRRRHQICVPLRPRALSPRSCVVFRMAHAQAGVGPLPRLQSRCAFALLCRCGCSCFVVHICRDCSCLVVFAQDVYTFVAGTMPKLSSEFYLTHSFPKKNRLEERTQTLSEAGLKGRILLCIEESDLTDEEEDEGEHAPEH